jgi:hypothetical protein
LTALGDPSATLLLVNLNDTNLLEGLEDSAFDLAGGVDVVGGARAAVLGGSVDLAETANTDGLAEVDVTSDSGGANVEPVSVLGRKLVGSGGLDSVDPTRDGELSLTLQESGVSADELLGIDVPDCDTTHICELFLFFVTVVEERE